MEVLQHQDKEGLGREGSHCLGEFSQHALPGCPKIFALQCRALRLGEEPGQVHHPRRSVLTEQCLDGTAGRRMT